MLTLNHSQLPQSLLQLAHPVSKLHVAGNDFKALLERPRLAIVGSRKVTPYGRGVTQALTSALAAKGVVIISGLALGVDSIAHQAALDAGGQTIAVLPTGLDRIYPSSHTSLGLNILKQGGALVTEYDPGAEPYKTNFLERNRIIAGLAEAVLVTEAAARSGSLNTANHALELGKPVLTVPGNITSPMSAGCNNLIKAGAMPVTSVEDILQALNWQDKTAKSRATIAHNKEEQAILSLLKDGVTDGAEMQAMSRLEPAMFNQTLTMLELTGRVRPTGANHWSL